MSKIKKEMNNSRLWVGNDGNVYIIYTQKPAYMKESRDYVNEFYNRKRRRLNPFEVLCKNHFQRMTGWKLKTGEISEVRIKIVNIKNINMSAKKIKKLVIRGGGR